MRPLTWVLRTLRSPPTPWRASTASRGARRGSVSHAARLSAPRPPPRRPRHARYLIRWLPQVMFVTGTDEHGEKIALAAEKQGKTPKQHW